MTKNSNRNELFYIDELCLEDFCRILYEIDSLAYMSDTDII